MADSAQVRGIKDYIVKAHKAGACGKFGEHMPREKMGERGSAYRGTMTATERRRYRREYVRTFGHD